MYKLPHFTETNNEAIIEFIKQNSFAIVTGIGENFPVATHIPLDIKIINGKIFLEGHVMKKSDHHLSFEKNNNVLAIFTGPHCYVSASWYTNPINASTWNYTTVHAKGKITFNNEQGTINIIEAITKKYEGENSAASFNKMPTEYINAMVKAIIGFSIEVESIENVFKLSQNRDDISKQNIIKQLKLKGDYNSIEIAKEIEKQLR